MKLKFKIQQYQSAAVENVVEVFSGQPHQDDTSFSTAPNELYDIIGYSNAAVRLNEQQLLQNIQSIQTQSNIHPSKELSKELGECQIDVEMETGTGKTYVYIKTMFELNRLYGWTKFMVVVPSIAIREGVAKSFETTADHFMELYGKKVRYFIYSSDNLSQIDAYSQSSDICAMIINTQAFNTSLKEGASNKVARIIYDERDEFRSRRPIDVIASNRPIIILDEPQKMGGAATQKALELFKPLFTLNYSATHKQTHNPVYVLDALDAYNQRLVKKIEVVGFELKHLSGTSGYLYLSELILSSNKGPQASLEFEICSKGGEIRRQTKKLSEGDDLYTLSGNMEQYRGYRISDIHVDPLCSSQRSYVEFGNGLKIGIKEVLGDIDPLQKARIQIRATIVAHLRKESKLFHKGIKCLSLFFIDEVAKYRLYDQDGEQLLGPYGEIFEQEYEAVLQEFRADLDEEYLRYLDHIPVHSTHSGYFSIDKKGHSIDSPAKRGTDLSDDTSAYDLILKNKERLLSFEEPVRFIFSHSALREGWDNPNVFQICSLRQSGSTAQKRQEVGRGLRLSVDRYGVRQDTDLLGEDVQEVNRLTVIASQAYASFSAELQKDIRADLYECPTKADTAFFTDKVLLLKDGTTHKISLNEASLIFAALNGNDYIDDDGNVTDTFRAAASSGELAPLPKRLEPYSEAIYAMVRGIFDPSAVANMVEDANMVTIPQAKLQNENFSKQEFQQLWKAINHKWAYLVSFDSKELIDKAVVALDKELRVSHLSYTITTGAQKDKLSYEQISQGNMMSVSEEETEYIDLNSGSSVRYDLLGKVASSTGLTRKSIARILTNIRPETFDQYKANPEEFIRKTATIILEQKATMIVEHISYNQIDGQYDSSIFTQEKHGSMDKAVKGKKSIVDWVFTDGTAQMSNEHKFLEKLETASEVLVYAKLPKGFHIPTPMGNYSPDWAIAFDKDKVKHVYFVAETKGSMSSLELREIERRKIECADKLFKELLPAKVRYGKVGSYEDLLNLVK